MTNIKLMTCIFALLTFTFKSCNSEHNKVLVRLESLLKSNSIYVKDSMDYCFNANSIEYLKEVHTNSLHGDLVELEYLGARNGCPITTLIIGEALKKINKDTVTFDHADDVLLIVNILGLGVFRRSDDFQIRPYEMGSINKNIATVKVSIPTGVNNTNIVSEYRLAKEDDIWKLDLPSTFNFQEKIFNQMRIRSGVSTYDFAVQYMESSPELIEFSYKRYYKD